jgi:putative SOS response-associated peptidase YedK
VKLDEEGDRELTLMRWGLVPFFTKDDNAAFKSTSARAEKVATLPTYREAFKRRHCIVPADWFYEWQALAARINSTCLYLKSLRLNQDAVLLNICRVVSPAAERFASHIS